ncbi:MAG: DUF3472 domain-containing protein [Chlorobi bacterium]|nr:DUF3472 domain-containing protein [Chlorobiota bacterium]
MKIPIFVLTVLLLLFLYSCENEQDKKMDFNISIPTAGNSWILDKGTFVPSEMIASEGIRNWQDKNKTIRTFFYIGEAGQISIGLRAKVRSGASKLKCIFQNNPKEITITDTAYSDYPIGDFQIMDTGYYYVDIKGLEKEDEVFANVLAVLLKSENPSSIKYVKDDFYFGRRGPSDHLNFEIPPGVDNMKWFYSELLIPKGQDVAGSYFMANGFAEGYFGIQVNSMTERRILFSVWSPYKTNNPSDIPEDYKIKLLKKGEGVTSREFGNEGSGGQSYKIYNWKAGITYGFLLGAKPDGNGNTDYVAYFYGPEKGKWNLIAQFRRPKTNTYLKRLHSFLENFIPDQGVFERKALYQSQWVYDNSGWHEITKAVFTADNTARKEYRLDYSGGIEGNGFFLRNCGFTNNHVSIGSKFERRETKKEPQIDFPGLD